MKKFTMFLMLIFLVSACTNTAPVAPPVDTLGNTPAPTRAATDTLSSTPTPPNASPTIAATDTLSSTPTPPNTNPLIAAIPHSALNPSGPYLAYLRSQGDRYEIVLTDADGKGQKLIPYPADASTQISLPSLSDTLSQDGQWLAYYTGSAGKCFGNGGADTADLTLNLMNLSNGKTQVITKLLSQDYPSIFAKAAQELNLPDEILQNAFVCGITQSIDWSPDGHTLAFAGQMDGLSSDLYIYDLASQIIKRLSSGPEEVQNIAWSPDGRWILSWSSYAVGEGMTSDLYVTSLDGSIINKLPVSSCGTARWVDDQTCFSSEDGNGVGIHNLSLLNIKTGAVVPVWAGEFSSLAVSADHQWLVYISHYSSQSLKTGRDPNFVPGLYLVNLGTLKSSRVVLPGNLDDYSALQALGSGDRTFGLLNTSENSLYFLSVDGKLTPTGVNATLFSLSPDRQSLVAIGQKIRVLKADGTSIRDVDLPANLVSRGIGTIIWRLDSSGLFFTYQDPNDYNSPVQLYAMDLLTGSPELVDSLAPGGPADFVWVGMPK